MSKKEETVEFTVDAKHLADTQKLAGKVLDILSSYPFADYKLSWTWEEMWIFISQLSALAGRPEPTYNHEVISKPEIAEACYSKEMREHIEKYHNSKEQCPICKSVLPEICKKCCRATAIAAIVQARKEKP